MPGQLFSAAAPHAVTTILGSCVAVCLWDEHRAHGGLNHFLLPRSEDAKKTPRFGDVAIPELMEALAALGSERRHLRAKLFGGAQVIAGGASGDHLGLRNVALARETLERLGVPVVAEDTGGQRGRKLIFHTDDGEAWVKYL